ncbi:MAG: hypothetical protein WC839_01260 [Candidatus Paceibacterota bacterium]
MQKNNKQKGISILGILFLGLIIILVISYFKINIKSVIESPVTKDNMSYVGVGTRNLWDDYLKEPVSYLWKEIFINNLWKSFISGSNKNIENTNQVDLATQ